MKEIPLSNGGVALVDDEDFEYLSQWSWQRNSHGYPRRTMRKKGGGWRTVLMHRLLMKAEKGQQVEHKDNNPSNVRKSNLRFSNQSDNLANKNRPSWAKRPFRGVRQIKNTWVAEISIDNRCVYIGSFPSPEIAAAAYDLWTLTRHGKFARTNFKVVSWGP